MLHLLRDLLVGAAVMALCFCIYETLNPEYDRPPLKARFQLFLVRLFDLLFHAGMWLAGSFIELAEAIRKRRSLFRYPRP